MNLRQSIAVVTLALTAGAAGAQALYIGGAGGAKRSNADCTGTLSCDNSDTGWKAFAGYHVNPVFSVEVLGYDYGGTSGVVSFPGTGLVNASLTTTGFGLAGVINAPLGPTVGLLGRLGVGSNQLKVSASSGGLSGSDSETSTQFLWGVGLAFWLSPNLALRTEIDGTSATYFGERFDSTLFSVGLSVRF